MSLPRLARLSPRPKALLANSVLMCAAVAVALLSLELALRVRHGSVFTLESRRAPTPNWMRSPRANYDAQLGWVPKPGANDPAGIETVTPAGLRSNGDGNPGGDRPILTVGDSFTFGDEVPDGATWPAQLSRILGSPVLNGGVFAYGVDQAFLRASRLLQTYQPSWVVLAFIRGDVNRSQFSYYSAWKPYFALEDGGLVLHNVPVPTAPGPEPQLAWLRGALSHSFLATALASRYADGWWYYGAILREHSDGVAVATELITRLDDASRAAGARLLVVALSTGGVIGTNEGMRAIVDDLRQRGTDVLDLVPEIEAMVAEGQEDLFMAGGHYAPRLNELVARRVADHIASPR